MWNNDLAAEAYNFLFIIESILSLMAVNGIARSTYNTTLSRTLKGAVGSLGFNSPQSVFEDPSPPLDTNLTAFTMYTRA